jgi:hypothetical protein
VVDRIVTTLTRLDFPGVVTGAELYQRWGAAADRYAVLLARARTDPALSLPTDVANYGEAAAASHARTLATIVPAAGDTTTPSTQCFDQVIPEPDIPEAPPPSRLLVATPPPRHHCMG